MNKDAFCDQAGWDMNRNRILRDYLVNTKRHYATEIQNLGPTKHTGHN